MKINPINNTTFQQNNSKTQAAPSFTSILPAKVFIDGNISIDEKNIKRVVRALSEILFKHARTSEEIAIQRTFAEHDRDFCVVVSSNDKSQVLRNRILDKDGKSYLFTGPHAQRLDALGREIGPAKAKGKRLYGTTKTFESTIKVRDYFSRIRQFIDSNMSAHVCEKIKPGTYTYEGEKVGVHIHAKSEGKPDKPGFKVIIDKIIFRKIQEPTVNMPHHHAA